MIVQDIQTENNSMTLDVRRTEYYEESFEINFLFPILNEASWEILDSGHGWVQFCCVEDAVVKHIKELMEYTGEDYLRVIVDGTETPLAISFNKEEVQLTLELEMDDMGSGECYDIEISMEIV